MGANYAKQEEQYNLIMQESEIKANSLSDLKERMAKHMNQGKVVEKEWKALLSRDKEIRAQQEHFGDSKKSENIFKNRYGDILPLDKTRVKLKNVDEDDSDYINANHVKIQCYQTPRNYICSQAPVPHTLSHFHQMLWEQNVKIVVMLTRHVEGGRLKADRYLPDEKTVEKYGDIEVEVMTEEKKGESYTIREFTMQKGEEKRPVKQFHYEAWPDHGVPDDPKPLLEMARKVEEIHQQNADSPVVVHCSAGIGRTGAYILITEVMNHLYLQKKKEKPEFCINIMKLVHEMREGRTGMVQHSDQYQFCYQTILSYIEEISQDK